MPQPTRIAADDADAAALAMEQWKRVAIMVTIFTFSLELQPLDSFLTAYLTDSTVNATLDEVTTKRTGKSPNAGKIRVGPVGPRFYERLYAEFVH